MTYHDEMSLRSVSAMVGIISILATIAPSCDVVSAASPLWTVYLHDILLPEELEGLVDVTRSESVEFMPHGKSVVTAGYFYDSTTQKTVGEVVIRSSEDGSTRAKLHGTASSYALRAGTLAIGPSGDWIAAAGRTADNARVIDIFDAQTMKLARTIQPDDPSAVVCLRFSPTGQLLAAAHLQGMVELWDFRTGRLVTKFKAHERRVWPIDFSANGKLLATGSEGSPTLWRMPTGERVATTEPARGIGGAGALAFSTGRVRVALGGTPAVNGDSPISIWQVQEDSMDGSVALRHEMDLHGHREHTYSLTFSPDGRLLASANQDRTVRIWDLERAGKAVIIEHSDFAYDVAFSPDGSRIATLSRDSLGVWEMADLVNED